MICTQYQKFFLPQGKYQDLALLWRQTGKLTHKLCFNVNHMAQLAISRNEFYKYFLPSERRESFKKIIVFSTKDDETIFAIENKTYIHKGRLVHSITIGLS
jgi:hypothetical protein